MNSRKRVIICGAAGRDFHNFHQVYRDDASTEVIAFTAAQIPGIENRRYPASLAGTRYPEGIPILSERKLSELCAEFNVDEVVFSYSDVTHSQVMDVASIALAAGANFTLLGPQSTMLKAKVPCISICAVRTGCGKSQIARYIASQLASQGIRVAVLRHPMPYGDLEQQAVQRFASMADIDAANCTIEEREEYEPHVAAGNLLYAGVDYEKILEQAQTEADIILWDGGNNDFSFVQPDCSIVVVDALRPDHLDTHYPGSAVLLAADMVVVSKANSASPDQLELLASNLKRLVPQVPVIMGRSDIRVDQPDRLKGRRVIVVEDGPTLTHGGMPHGAGYQAVKDIGTAQLVDPHLTAAPMIAKLFEQYPHIGPVLPAMGYSPAQIQALKETIECSSAEVIVAGTPIDLAAILSTKLPVVRAHYDYADTGPDQLMSHVNAFVQQKLKG